MTIEWAALIEGGIPVVGGLYAAALGFGLIRPAGLPLLHRPGLLTQLKWLGPAMAVFGIYTGWQSHSHHHSPRRDRDCAQGRNESVYADAR